MVPCALPRPAVITFFFFATIIFRAVFCHEELLWATVVISHKELSHSALSRGAKITCLFAARTFHPVLSHKKSLRINRMPCAAMRSYS